MAPATIGQPVSACKNTDEWLGVPAGSALNVLVAGQDTNAGVGSLQVNAGLESTVQVTGVAATFTVICFTPGGKVYVTTGPDVPTAIGLLPAANAFTGDVIMEVLRKPGGVQVGLRRQIIMTSSGAVRIHSK